MTVPTSRTKGTGHADPAAVAPTPWTSLPYRPTSRNSERRPARHAGEVALTPDELVRLLDSVTEVRDLALLTLAATTGIRREDLVAIPLSGYDANRGELQFYEAKKRRTRTVPLDVKAARRLDLYLHSRDRESRWLFPSPRVPRSHISGRHAWDVLNYWLDRVNLPRRPFHALRATAYKLAKARGWSVEFAAALLGDTIRVAQEFYGVATPGEMLETMRARPLLP